MATLFGSPAFAKRSDDAEMLKKYVEARLAESNGRPADAAVIYAETLKKQPDNLLLASKTYVKAIESGDFHLAFKAVRALELGGAVDPEMPLLLFADAFARKDYKAAELASLELKAREHLAFLTPLLNAWIANASGKSPVKELSLANKDKNGAYYHQEQLILHALAGGYEADVMQLIDALIDRREPRMAPLRILIARHFLAIGNEEQAQKILQHKVTGSETRMFREVQAGNTHGLAQKADAMTGAAFLLQRLAADLGAQRAYFSGLVIAQAAANISPDNDYGRHVLADAYGNIKNSAAAIAELKKIPDNSIYALQAINMEIARYIETKNYTAGHKRMEETIALHPDIPELRALSGQLFQVSGNNKAAAKAYEDAIILAEKRNLSDRVLASYWLALGGAQEQAGLWPKGLESLKKANALLPKSASILNYLGYAQLERRENTKAAIAAIRKAYKLRPSSPAITDSLGWAYYITGEYEKAVDYLELARAGEPHDPTINEHLGDAYWAVGRKYEARYAWKSAKLFADITGAERLTDKIDLGLRANLVSP
ncbi:tetratricopeptide repeat protein [Parasphingorhabdus sp. JC815]|uniref:tetratricopeptide repeat protein n=1 Tax=Parasphingorhabdus sp. JC815 TaxID=3232140 RepID=UPI00345B44EA